MFIPSRLSEHDVPRYLLHDRDSVFADVATTIAGMNMQTVRTAPAGTGMRYGYRL
jgi:hypothetical protein